MLDKDLSKMIKQLASTQLYLEEEGFHGSNIAGTIELNENIEDDISYLKKLQLRLRGWTSGFVIGVIVLIIILLYMIYAYMSTSFYTEDLAPAIIVAEKPLSEIPVEVPDVIVEPEIEIIEEPIINQEITRVFFPVVQEFADIDTVVDYTYYQHRDANHDYSFDFYIENAVYYKPAASIVEQVTGEETCLGSVKPTDYGFRWLKGKPSVGMDEPYAYHLQYREAGQSYILYVVGTLDKELAQSVIESVFDSGYKATDFLDADINKQKTDAILSQIKSNLGTVDLIQNDEGQLINADTNEIPEKVTVINIMTYLESHFLNQTQKMIDEQADPIYSQYPLSFN